MTCCSLLSVNWQEMFRFKDVNGQVAALNSVIGNVFENFTLNKTSHVSDNLSAFIKNF